jgi:hypothetical protein
MFFAQADAGDIDAIVALWSAGVVTRRVYERAHARFLIALAPLGSYKTTSEVGYGRTTGGTTKDYVSCCCQGSLILRL